MPDKDAGTPRVYLARHGETSWTINGRYTGTTKLDLTPTGVQQVLRTGRMLVGSGKLVDPSKLARVFISPRRRAQRTWELLFNEDTRRVLVEAEKVRTTEEIAEWNYGRYEGLVTGEIRERRRGMGFDAEGEWDIWRDGCEDGESPAQVTHRLDGLIEEIQELQKPYMRGEGAADVVLIAHGHILRAFTKRWLKYPMDFPLSMMIEPGGIGTLSYQHHNVAEPAFVLGMAIPAE